MRTARHDEYIAGTIIQNARGCATQKGMHQAASSVHACDDEIGIGFIRQYLESGHRVHMPDNDLNHRAS